MTICFVSATDQVAGDGGFPSRWCFSAMPQEHGSGIESPSRLRSARIGVRGEQKKRGVI
jgi:hypothetical protein